MIFITMLSFHVNTYIEEEIEQNDTLSAFTRAISRVSSGRRISRKFSQIFSYVPEVFESFLIKQKEEPKEFFFRLPNEKLI